MSQQKFWKNYEAAQQHNAAIYDINLAKLQDVSERIQKRLPDAVPIPHSAGNMPWWKNDFTEAFFQPDFATTSLRSESSKSIVFAANDDVTVPVYLNISNTATYVGAVTTNCNAQNLFASNSLLKAIWNQRINITNLTQADVDLAMAEENLRNTIGAACGGTTKITTIKDAKNIQDTHLRNLCISIMQLYSKLAKDWIRNGFPSDNGSKHNYTEIFNALNNLLVNPETTEAGLVKLTQIADEENAPTTVETSFFIIGISLLGFAFVGLIAFLSILEMYPSIIMPIPPELILVGIVTTFISGFCLMISFMSETRLELTNIISIARSSQNSRPPVLEPECGLKQSYSQTPYDAVAASQNSAVNRQVRIETFVVHDPATNPFASATGQFPLEQPWQHPSYASSVFQNAPQTTGQQSYETGYGYTLPLNPMIPAPIYKPQNEQIPTGYPPGYHASSGAPAQSHSALPSIYNQQQYPPGYPVGHNPASSGVFPGAPMQPNFSQTPSNNPFLRK